MSRPSSSGSRKSQESHDSHTEHLKRRVRNLLSKFSDRAADFKSRIDVPLSPQSVRSVAGTPQKIINDDDDVIVVETKREFF